MPTIARGWMNLPLRRFDTRVLEQIEDRGSGKAAVEPHADRRARKGLPQLRQQPAEAQRPVPRLVVEGQEGEQRQAAPTRRRSH
jgi:hypothetical protein